MMATVPFQEANPTPWNLRTRKAACNCKAPHQTQENNNKRKNMEQETQPERPIFSLSLSKDEVQHDFRAFLGSRPPRRPKKRPKISRTISIHFFLVCASPRLLQNLTKCPRSLNEAMLLHFSYFHRVF